MYLLVLGYINGKVEYYGPFPTRERAIEYEKSCQGQGKYRFHTHPVVVPHNVVTLKWKTAKPRHLCELIEIVPQLGGLVARIVKTEDKKRYQTSLIVEMRLELNEFETLNSIYYWNA